MRREMNRLGYTYRQARKKGLLTDDDISKRLKFAKSMVKNYPETVWTNDICFYFDGSSFVHKTNPADQARAPRARVWRKPSEGLSKGCTAKGKKAGYGGKVLHLFVAISFGKGVCFCEEYEKLTGTFFANFVKTKFENRR